MKYIKYFLRILIIAPFILGLPIGFNLMTNENYRLSVIEGIIAIPGLVSCCILMLFCFALLGAGIGYIGNWIYKD